MLEARQRPIGVTVLSIAAFASSAGLVWLTVKIFQAIHAEVTLPLWTVEPARLIAVMFCLGMFYASLLALSALSFVAGRDLWNLRPRGRSLTLTTMILLLVLSVFFLIRALAAWEAGWEAEKALVLGICCLSVVSSVYLFLPDVRARFQGF
jgi:hypothetical protein